METTIDWSYRLLEPSEQSLLRHLSVFPSSFDVRAVEASAPPLSGAVPVTEIRWNQPFDGLADQFATQMTVRQALQYLQPRRRETLSAQPAHRSEHPLDVHPAPGQSRPS